MGAVSTTEVSRNQDHDREVYRKHEGIAHAGDAADAVAQESALLQAPTI